MRIKNIFLAIVVLISGFNMAKADKDKVEIMHLSIEEKLEDESIRNQVSTQARQFRLILDHDANYIPEEGGEDFKAKDSIVLQNLSIIKRDLNREKKNKKDITANYDFELEAASTDSPDYPGMKRTVFISNQQIIKKGQRLNFKLSLRDYLDEYLGNLPLRSENGELSNDDLADIRDIDAKVIARYEINSLELKFSSVDFVNSSNNGDSLVFYNRGKDGESRIISEAMEIIAFLESNLNITNLVKKIDYRSEGATGKRIKAKIKKDGTRNQKHRVVVNERADVVVASNGVGLYKINIPVELKSKNKLTNAEKQSLSKLDTVIVPIILDLKTDDGLDLNASGSLRKAISISFDANGQSAN